MRFVQLICLLAAVGNARAPREDDVALAGRWYNELIAVCDEMSSTGSAHICAHELNVVRPLNPTINCGSKLLVGSYFASRNPERDVSHCTAYELKRVHPNLTGATRFIDEVRKPLGVDGMRASDTMLPMPQQRRQFKRCLTQQFSSEPVQSGLSADLNNAAAAACMSLGRQIFASIARSAREAPSRAERDELLRAVVIEWGHPRLVSALLAAYGACDKLSPWDEGYNVCIHTAVQPELQLNVNFWQRMVPLEGFEPWVCGSCDPHSHPDAMASIVVAGSLTHTIAMPTCPPNLDGTPRGAGVSHSALNRRVSNRGIRQQASLDTNLSALAAHGTPVDGVGAIFRVGQWYPIDEEDGEEEEDPLQEFDTVWQTLEHVQLTTGSTVVFSPHWRHRVLPAAAGAARVAVTLTASVDSDDERTCRWHGGARTDHPRAEEERVETAGSTALKPSLDPLPGEEWTASELEERLVTGGSFTLSPPEFSRGRVDERLGRAPPMLACGDLRDLTTLLWRANATDLMRGVQPLSCDRRLVHRSSWFDDDEGDPPKTWDPWQQDEPEVHLPDGTVRHPPCPGSSRATLRHTSTPPSERDCYTALCPFTPGMVRKTLFAFPADAPDCLGPPSLSDLARSYYIALTNLRSARRLQWLTQEGLPQLAHATPVRLTSHWLPPPLERHPTRTDPHDLEEYTKGWHGRATGGAYDLEESLEEFMLLQSLGRVTLGRRNATASAGGWAAAAEVSDALRFEPSADLGYAEFDQAWAPAPAALTSAVGLERQLDELNQQLEARGLWLCDLHAGNIGADRHGRLQIFDADMFTDEEWHHPIMEHYDPIYRLLEATIPSPLLLRSLASLRARTVHSCAHVKPRPPDHPSCEHAFLAWATRIPDEALRVRCACHCLSFDV